MFYSMYYDIRGRLSGYPEKWQRAVLITCLMFFFLSMPCFAETITIEWDPNSDATHYIVYWGESSGSYTFNSPIINSPATAYTLTIDDGKQYYFAVKAFNDCGNSSNFSTEMAYSPSGTNLPPTADAGPDQIVNEGISVVLNAGNSSDPDDGIASYEWIQTGGPAVSITDSGSVQATFISPDVTTDGTALTFQITVSDTIGNQTTDTCIVNVTFVNTAPVAEAGPSQTVSELTGVTLDGSGSTDEDDGIASYLWRQTSGPSVSLSGATTATALFISPDVGTAGASLTFQLEVTDSGGLKSTDDCIINVSYVNMPPVADAGSSQTVSEGGSVTLDAGSSSDPDGSITSYLWTQTAGPAVTLSSAISAQPTFTAPDVTSDGAILSFQITVTDSGGLQSSASSSVTVSNVNAAPVAEAGPSQDVNEGITVVLDGENSSDPDGGITSYAWIQTGGLDVTLSDASVSKPSFTAPSVSTDGAILTFQLTVTDAEGLTATDNCTITVSDSAIVETPPEPVSPDLLTATLSDYPSIEVLDTNLQHLHWLKIGWADYVSTNGEARIATGDIDGDGKNEIIIGMAQVPDNPAMPGGFFQILDHDYSHLAWGYVNWPEYNSINGETWPACGDLNGDGDDEIIIGLGPGGEGTLEVFDYDDQGLFHMEWIIGTWNDYNTAVGETRPVCGDIDNDGFDEIIVGLGQLKNSAGIPNGYFDVIDSDFTHITWGEISWPDYNAANGETWPACGDITGDGQDDIIAGLGAGGNGRVQVFEFDLNTVKHNTWIQIDWLEYNDLSGETRPSVADIDNDGRNEVITGLGQVRKNRSVPGGQFQINDDNLSVVSWGQVGWKDYNTSNGETRLSHSIIQPDGTVFVALGAKQVKGGGTSTDKKAPPGKNK